MKPLGALVLMRRDGWPGKNDHRRRMSLHHIQRKRKTKMRKTAKAITAVAMAAAMTVPAFAAGITEAQAREIAETKMPDLNAANIESAISMIAGTARSMGVVVVD